jgi:hypothetical protein
LFDDAPKALLDKIEQVVRLIRSKGVGVYFVTQNPLDVPETVLAQLGNRVQHALRAFTPREQKAVRTAAETFRPNPKLDTAQVITEMGKGEALVSTLEGNGVPSMVQRTLIRPPAARVGPVSPEERAAVLARSTLRGKYDTPIDAESAYEVLKQRTGQRGPSPRPGERAPAPRDDDGRQQRPHGPWGNTGIPAPQDQPWPQDDPQGQRYPQNDRYQDDRYQDDRRGQPQGEQAGSGGIGGTLGGILDGIFGGGTGGTGSGTPGPRGGRPAGRASVTEVVVKQVARSVASQVGTQLGRAILRGVLGGMRR